MPSLFNSTRVFSTRVFVLIFLSLFAIPAHAFADVPASLPADASPGAAPLYADAKQAPAEASPAAVKPTPAETKTAPSETKTGLSDAKAVAPDVKQAQATPSPKPAQDAKTTPAAPGREQAGAPDKSHSIGGRSSTAFIENGDTELVDVDKIEAKDGEKPPAEIAAAVDLVNNKDESGNLYSPIEKNIHYFSVAVKNHFAMWLGRSGKYMGLMKSILRENYLPEDLVFLALIESGFNTKAYSVARASGPWQFIRGTGQRYGLRIDNWVDERRDPIKSTQAAARYLKDLYGMFGSWPLAMASYNAGEGNVARAITRNNGSLDFWELRKTRYLPSETKDYVPKFVAAKMIADNPTQYGFNDVEYQQPFEFDEVELDHCTDLGLVAKCCNCPVEEIKELNPELIRSCTPPNKETYKLRIPKGKKDEFLAAYNALPDDEKVTNPPRIAAHGRKRYVARRGDTLKKVAKRLNIPVSELVAANHIKADARLRKGQRIRIPSSEADGTMVASKRHHRSAHGVRLASHRRHRHGQRLARAARRSKVKTASRGHQADPA